MPETTTLHVTLVLDLADPDLAQVEVYSKNLDIDNSVRVEMWNPSAATIAAAARVCGWAIEVQS